MLGRKSQPKSEEKEDRQGFDAYDVCLGDVMRGERATMGKSLLDVQRELKIKATYIAAVENADHSVFETPGFIAGYVRSYARYLGMDPEWAYNRFCEESGFSGIEGLSSAANKPKNKTTRARSGGDDAITKPVAPYAPAGEALMSRIEPGAIGSILVLFALIAALGYGGYSVLREIQRVEFAPVDQAPGVTADVATFETGPTIAAPAGTASAGLSAPSADALDRLYRPQALEAPVLTARDGPIAAIDPGTNGTTPDPVVSEVDETQIVRTSNDLTPFPPVQVVERQEPDVVVFAVRPAWVRIADPDGTVLFEKILDAGERYVLPQTEVEPLLRAGNSGSVYFSVLGETLGPAGPGTSVAKNVALGVEAIIANYEEADPNPDPSLPETLRYFAENPLDVPIVDRDAPIIE